MADPHSSSTRPDFAELIDLASARFGGQTLLASDDFFAPKENLLKPEPPIFIPGKFTDLGKWMDGWESRRKREPGHDWCIIRLGLPGIIRGFNVDTAYFNGNQPETCTIEAVEALSTATGADLARPSVSWTTVLERSPLGPSQEHFLPASVAAIGQRFTHLRFNIFPDGGVARLRVFGDAMADWGALKASGKQVDLAAATNGGLVIAANDMHFGSRHNLIMPGRAANMGDGWETRRKRGLTWRTDGPAEHDWCIVRLGHRGTIEAIEVDTNHFKGNFPESCSIEICDHPDGMAAPHGAGGLTWRPLLPRTSLRANHQHMFVKELQRLEPCTHARLTIYPDGGVSRLRLLGRPA